MSKWSEVRRPETPERRERIDAIKAEMAIEERIHRLVEVLEHRREFERRGWSHVECATQDAEREHLALFPADGGPAQSGADELSVARPPSAPDHVEYIELPNDGSGIYYRTDSKET